VNRSQGRNYTIIDAPDEGEDQSLIGKGKIIMELKTKRAVAAEKKNRASEDIQSDDVLRIHNEVFYGRSRARTTLRLKNSDSGDYMLVLPDGSVLNKQEVLQDLRTNGLTFHSIELRESTVRIYGPTAVLTGESRSP
jgi:hypothetical protein